MECDFWTLKYVQVWKIKNWQKCVYKSLPVKGLKNYTFCQYNKELEPNFCLIITSYLYNIDILLNVKIVNEFVIQECIYDDYFGLLYVCSTAVVCLAK